MLSMKIPAEIQEYKSKLIFGLSARQFFSIAGAILVGVPIGMFGRGRISADVLPWFVIIAVMPFFAFGFFTFHGMRFEELVKAIIPFVLISFVVLALVTFIPDISLFIPRLLGFID